jgi:hypothetical protein
VARDEASRAALGRAVRTLGGAIDDTPGTPPADETLPAAYAVARLVAEASGFRIPVVPVPPAESDLDAVEQIGLIARFRTRPLRLDGEWWRTDLGPMLGYLRASNAPVALLRRGREYQLVDPAAGPPRRGTAPVAASLAPDAVNL